MANPFTLIQTIQADLAEQAAIAADLVSQAQGLAAVLDPNQNYIMLNNDGTASLVTFDQSGYPVLTPAHPTCKSAFRSFFEGFI